MKLIRINDVPETGVSHNPKIRKRAIIGSGQVGPITQYAHAVFPPGEAAPAHVHDDMAEVFTVISGRGDIRINDVAFVFSAGMTVVVEPGDKHAIINTGARDLVLSYFGVLMPERKPNGLLIHAPKEQIAAPAAPPLIGENGG